MNTYSPQGFKMLPNGVKHLLIINALFFLSMIVFRQMDNPLPMAIYDRYLVLYPIGQGFYPWQLITYQFVHANFDHIFFNMFSLWMFGYVLENYWGTTRFILYYLLCGIGAGITCLLVGTPTVGASGAVYGILLAFGMMFPNERIYLYFLLPIKAIWFVIIFGLIELFDGIFMSGDGVAHFAHLGGMLTGFILLMFWRWQAKKKIKY
ncbi:MAG: rhomboid family intramembrane serine protease [Bacteroidales bacterium]|nr:rhomboid family intramembrane serine protease [Bacteroidales bacterium]